ncbi:MAG: HAD family phosphatase [Clostridia bacterium]|nr:HAD family phosphatase [Clostridia bacterium]
MIKNIIFDFGKVITNFEPDIIMSGVIRDSSDRAMLEPILFDRKYWDKLDDGTVTESEVFEQVKDKIPEKLRTQAKEVLIHWYRYLPIYDEMVKIINKLKENGKKIYLLSNISKDFSENYKNVPKLSELLKLFDGFVFSSKEGIVKPSREIFELVLKRYSLKENETLFVDDREKNIDGAKLCGINTYLFKEDFDVFEKFLKENNIVK